MSLGPELWDDLQQADSVVVVQIDESPSFSVHQPAHWLRAVAVIPAKVGLYHFINPVTDQRKPKVDEDHALVVRTEGDVLGLDVAVDDSGLVQQAEWCLELIQFFSEVFNPIVLLLLAPFHAELNAVLVADEIETEVVTHVWTDPESRGNLSKQVLGGRTREVPVPTLLPNPGSLHHHTVSKMLDELNYRQLIQLMFALLIPEGFFTIEDADFCLEKSEGNL